MREYPLLRPVRFDDLESFIDLAYSAGPGITSLPQHRETLEKKLHDSLRAFQLTDLTPEYENYLFCLEFNKQVIGISGIVSRIGMSEPFFAYRLTYEKQVCNYLKIDREIPLLTLIRARKKPTEIGTLFLKREFRKKTFGTILSLSRFLFIANFRYRFASTVIAELRGVNHEGISPLWEALGRKFIDLEFHEADLLRVVHPECIEEVFPQDPIYPNLLPEAAQKVIGVPHPKTIPAKKILEKQGFQVSDYVDLFDGGPHLYASTEEIRTVRESRVAVVRELRSQLKGEEHLVTNTKLDFRACVAPLLIEEERVVLPTEVASLLNIDIGDPVRYYAFH